MKVEICLTTNPPDSLKPILFDDLLSVAHRLNKKMLAFTGQLAVVQQRDVLSTSCRREHEVYLSFAFNTLLVL